MGSRLAAQGICIDPCPKDEHSKIGSAERAIGELDRMSACSVLDGNLPLASWDFVGEHCSLLNAVTRSCPTDDSITMYEAEAGMIPDLDPIPPLGCFGLRYLSKLDCKDFKLSHKNQAGVFLGFATLRSRVPTDLSLCLANDVLLLLNRLWISFTTIFLRSTHRRPILNMLGCMVLCNAIKLSRRIFFSLTF